MKLLSVVLAACMALLPVAGLAKPKGPMYAVPADERDRTDLATLILPEALDIQMVDGFEYAGFKNLFRRGDIQVRILPGEREVALKYNQLFEWGNNQHEMVRSKIIVLGFTAQPGKVYRATHDTFKTVEEARKGIENFVIRIEDEAGTNQVFGASQISSNWKGEETVMKRRDLASPDAAVAALAARDVAKAAAAPAPAVGATPAPAPAGAATAAAPAVPSVLDALKASWQAAGAADRAAFRAWLDSQ